MHILIDWRGWKRSGHVFQSWSQALRLGEMRWDTVWVVRGWSRLIVTGVFWSGWLIMVSRSPVFLSEFGRVSVPNLFGAERVQILTQKSNWVCIDGFPDPNDFPSIQNNSPYSAEVRSTPPELWDTSILCWRSSIYVKNLDFSSKSLPNIVRIQ